MKKTLLVFTAILFSMQGWSQNGIAPIDNPITPEISSFTETGNNGYKASRTTTCTEDTADYPLAKATSSGGFPLEADGAAGWGQRYVLDQNATVSGFQFFCYSQDTTKAGNNHPDSSYLVDVVLYDADPSTGLPASMLASTTVSIDSTPRWRYANFSSPVSVSDTFIVAVEAIRDSTLIVISNGAGDGQFENLSVVNAGGWQSLLFSFGFNRDLLFLPFISYDITADFGYMPDTICTADTVWFADSSSSILGNRMFNVSQYFGLNRSYSWDFGDGGQASMPNASHVYTDSGTYNVILYDSLFAWRAGTCADSTSKQIYIQRCCPTASYTNSTSCKTVSFTDNSTRQVLIDSVIWMFGDGNTSNMRNPTHTYASGGNYNVMLIVVDSSMGCHDTMTQTISINRLDADYTYSGSCVNDSTYFTDQTVTDAGIDSFYWNFDDGDSAFIQNPTHKFASTGTYNVTLTVWDNAGCVDSITKTVNIVNTITVNLGPDTGYCFGGQIMLDAGPEPLTYAWNTGDSTRMITADSAGMYWVQGFSSCGSDTDTVMVVEYTLPPADAGQDTAICQGGSAMLTATGGIAYNWNTGDTTSTVTVSPNSTTTFSVTVTDTNGCQNSDNVTVTVLPGPTADAGSDTSICFGSNAILSASGGVSYNWSTGDATQTITVSPSVPTTYTVTVTDSAGCQDSDNVTVNVMVRPTADFGWNETTNGTVNFSDSSLNAVTWVWDFDDGNTDSVQNPSHTYSSNGSYNVCLTVYGTNGCSHTTCKTVNVTTVGLQENTADNQQVKIYPNPNKGDFNLIIQGFAGYDATLEIYNTLGQKVYTESLHPSTASYKKEVKLNDSIPKGMYFVKVTSTEGTAVRKVFIE